MSSPCSLPLSINLRQSAEQTHSGSSVFCHSTSTIGFLDSGSLPSCSASLRQCWIALSYTFANSSPILNHTLVHIPSFSLSSFLDHSFLLLLTLPLHLPFLLLASVIWEGWSMAQSHKHAHTNICTARHHQEEMQHCIHSFSFTLHSLQYLSTNLHSKKNNFSCRNWRHENLGLCSRTLTLLNATYWQLNLAHKAKFTRGPTLGDLCLQGHKPLQHWFIFSQSHAYCTPAKNIQYSIMCVVFHCCNSTRTWATFCF